MGEEKEKGLEMRNKAARRGRRGACMKTSGSNLQRRSCSAFNTSIRRSVLPALLLACSWRHADRLCLLFQIALPVNVFWPLGSTSCSRWTQIEERSSHGFIRLVNSPTRGASRQRTSFVDRF